MRKYILLIALMLTVVISNAQITTANLAKDVTYWEYTTDVTLTNTTPKYFIINTQPDWYTAQGYIVQLDSVSGNHTNMAVVLAGRVSDQTSTWTTISTVNWTGASDTTIISINATENAYRQFKVTFTGTGTGVSKIDNFEFKQYNGLP